MERNLGLYGSFIASERIMMALAEEVGRQTAHAIVHENAEKALSGQTSFETCLREDHRVTDVLTDEELTELADPTGATGLSSRLVDRALATERRSSDSPDE